MIIIYLFYALLAFSPVSDSGDEVVWYTDFEEAKLLAEKEDKLVFMLFTGSDWCAACLRFKKKILLDERFQIFAKDHLVLLEVDFPRSRKNKLSEEQTNQNEQLAEVYNPQGIFPYLILIKGDKSIWHSSYEGEEVIRFVEKLEGFYRNKG